MTLVAFTVSPPKTEQQAAHRLRDALLRDLLDGRDPASVLRRASSGRPMLLLSMTDLSVSHSHGIAACALSFPGIRPVPVIDGAEVFIPDASPSSFRIGLDVETLADKSRARAEKVALRHFTHEENQQLSAAEDGAYISRFIAIWTQKESYLKMTGVGLAGLSSIDTLSPPEGVAIISRTFCPKDRPFILSLARSPFTQEQ